MLPSGQGGDAMSAPERRVADAQPDTDHALVIRLLTGEPRQMEALQRVIEEAPAYAHRITGVPPGPADALSTYTALPTGKDYEDKFVFGIYVGGTMIGCADLIRGFPSANTAMLGL